MDSRLGVSLFGQFRKSCGRRQGIAINPNCTVKTEGTKANVAFGLHVTDLTPTLLMN